MTNTMFMLNFPDNNWKETTVFTYEGPFDSGVQHNLVLVIDPAVNRDITLEEYAGVQIEGPKKTMPGFDIDKENTVTMPDGTPAYEIIYHYIPADGVVLYQKQVYMLRQGKAFIFSSTYSKKTLQTIAPVIDRIIAGFRLLG